jgi:hypothetical protein
VVRICSLMLMRHAAGLCGSSFTPVHLSAHHKLYEHSLVHLDEHAAQAWAHVLPSTAAIRAQCSVSSPVSGDAPVALIQVLRGLVRNQSGVERVHCFACRLTGWALHCAKLLLTSVTMLPS